jgi:hypothetical protein
MDAANLANRLVNDFDVPDCGECCGQGQGCQDCDSCDPDKLCSAGALLSSENKIKFNY